MVENLIKNYLNNFKDPETAEAPEVLLRHKRATCDLFANEQLCAAHCIVRGFRGGWCDSRKVCNCRR